MVVLRFLPFALLACAASAQAGLFTDDEAHQRIQDLEARIVKLETANKQLAETSDKQVKAMLDLQLQIEALSSELRKVRGQGEEVAHGVQDGEKRIRDFYVDLDARMRRIEANEEAAAKEAAIAKTNTPPVVNSSDSLDLAAENRAFESAYAVFKAGNAADTSKAFADYIKKFPDSVHIPNAKYWLGMAQLSAHDYQSALDTYQDLLNTASGYSKAPEVMFNMAACQQELKQNAAARKTLKQLIAKYPGSDAAVKASQLLSAAK